jgi:hypothetical protein
MRAGRPQPGEQVPGIAEISNKVWKIPRSRSAGRHGCRSNLPVFNDLAGSINCHLNGTRSAFCMYVSERRPKDMTLFSAADALRRWQNVKFDTEFRHHSFIKILSDGDHLRRFSFVGGSISA